ncbi:g8636 [Coccomyxa viridis]|uniref:G8636 protein n=1 Tax=Coccomyxa viridis TaxID=1274662 RepID=A0ABP1G7K3_9CHLO
MTQCRAGQVDRALLEAPVGELGHTGIEDGWQHITLDTGYLIHYEDVLRFPLDAWSVWESTHPRAYNEHSEEFKEKLRIFKRNAELLRDNYASRGDDPKLFGGMNNLTDGFPWDKWLRASGTLTGPYTGGVPFSWPPP